MNLREPTADDFPDVLRVARTMEVPEGPEQLEAYVITGDDAHLLTAESAEDIVGFIGVRGAEAGYRNFRLGLRPEYRTTENVEKLIDAADAERINLYFDETWLFDILTDIGFVAVDEFGQPNADGGFTLVKQ